MDRISLTITSELFDEPNQEASLRKNLSIRSLVGEIQREFNLPDAPYAVRVQGQPRALDMDKTLDQLGILTGAQLVFTRERRSMNRQSAPRPEPTGSKRMIMGPSQAYLVASTGQTFEILWEPAVIGRPEANNPASANQLAVNLGALEEARTVSRQHGRITERSGTYFIESLQAQNPVRLNGEEIAVMERRRLADGDELLMGKIVLTFRLRSADGDNPTRHLNRPPQP